MAFFTKLFVAKLFTPATAGAELLTSAALPSSFRFFEPSFPSFEPFSAFLRLRLATMRATCASSSNTVGMSRTTSSSAKGPYSLCSASIPTSFTAFSDSTYPVVQIATKGWLVLNSIFVIGQLNMGGCSPSTSLSAE
eukprot:CAMPEP_0173198090 /NCGR_PEP_ID=MMETSP1141-20130122/16505_1 /TAXON_ID=483371 /ORGANISM="non described non described, Strain CCMP2298" /LENGTH=136 /DNA_ID=CAMNT_0014122867 /DNA_START=147 /DNA_END=557 /DNA_ORIENTATION=-